MKKALLLLAIFDMILITTVFYVLIKQNFFLSLIVSFISTLAFFSLRVYDIDQLTDINSQIIRTFISSFLSLSLIAVVFISKDYLKFPEILLFSIVTSTTSSFFHRLYHPTIKRFLRRKIYYIPQSEYYKLKPILDEIHEKSLGSIIFTTDSYNHNSVLVLYEEMKVPEGENAIFLPDLAEKYLKRIPIEILRRFEQYYKVSFFNIIESPAKRVLDIIISIIGLIAFSPIMAIISIAILIEDGKPVIFRQRRIGKDGKEFILYKFRSMTKTNKDNTEKFATDEQHRILKTGKFIRKFRLDEVLQFINVLKGDMSVIGPRPEQTELAKEFENIIPEYKYRHLCKPGITGWAQLMYQYASNIEETKIKLSYDLWYIKNRNIFVDLKIILQTVEVILFRRGAK